MKTEQIDKKKLYTSRLEAINKFIAALPISVDKAILFGSVARGDFVLESDTDLLIVSREMPATVKGRLAMLAQARRAAPEVEAIGWTLEEYLQKAENQDNFFQLLQDEGKIIV